MYYLKVYNNVLRILVAVVKISPYSSLISPTLYQGLCFLNDILNFVYSLSYSFNIVQIPAS